LSEPAANQPPPADDGAEPEARPRKKRRPVGWSMIFIGVLVAVCVVLVWRRDGIHGVLEILTSDLALFGGILPRVLAGCLLGAFITEILPHEKVSRALGPSSGLKGLLIGTAFGAILPGGPFTAYPVAAALLTVGADFGDEGAEQAAGQHAWQDAAEQHEIAGENFQHAMDAVAAPDQHDADRNQHADEDHRPADRLALLPRRSLRLGRIVGRRRCRWGFCQMNESAVRKDIPA